MTKRSFVVSLARQIRSYSFLAGHLHGLLKVPFYLLLRGFSALLLNPSSCSTQHGSLAFLGILDAATSRRLATPSWQKVIGHTHTKQNQCHDRLLLCCGNDERRLCRPRATVNQSAHAPGR